jgi:uncharacterized membrane protein
MHRERSISLGIISVVADAAIILFAFFLSYLLVDTLKPYLPDPYHARRLYDLTYYGWWAMIDLFATLGLLYLVGIYTFSRTLTYFDLLLKPRGGGRRIVVFRHAVRPAGGRSFAVAVGLVHGVEVLLRPSSSYWGN